MLLLSMQVDRLLENSEIDQEIFCVLTEGAHAIDDAESAFAEVG